MKKSFLALSLLSSFLFAAEVNIYSARHYDADSELYKLFEQKTGIKLHATQAKAGELIKKLEVEGGVAPRRISLSPQTREISTPQRLKTCCKRSNLKLWKKSYRSSIEITTVSGLLSQNAPESSFTTKETSTLRHQGLRGSSKA